MSMPWTAAAISEDVHAAGYAAAEDALADFLSESISQVGSLWASFLASKKAQVCCPSHTGSVCAVVSPRRTVNGTPLCRGAALRRRAVYVPLPCLHRLTC